MNDAFPWSVLGIARTSDRKTIRKAYAEAIKAIDPDADVEGFAQLRRARDAALEMARTQPDSASEGERPDAGSASAPARWGHAAPNLAGDWIYDQSLSTRPAVSLDTLDYTGTAPRRGGDSASGGTLSLSLPWTPQGFAPPVLDGYGEVEAALGLTPGQSPLERLEDMLLEADGSQPDAPLGEAAETVARRALRTLIEEARDADVSRHERIETQLANLLANSWPRSGPLLEEAAEGFGWANEWDRFDARPVIAFIGERLRGLRFITKVEAGDHRYHRAWTELRRPGAGNPLRRLMISSADVKGLLSGIRHHFPEVEKELDAARVASWEKRHHWPRGLFAVFWLALLGLWVAFGWSGGKPEFIAPDGTHFPLEQGAPPAAELDRMVDAAVAEAFGEGRDLDWLWKVQHDLALLMVSNLEGVLRNAGNAPDATSALVDIVRQRLLFTTHHLTGTELDEAARLRLGLLRAARDSSMSRCVDFLGTAHLDTSVEIPETLRKQERALAARLADKGALKAPRPGEAQSVAVPGNLIGKVIAATGLPEATVRIALHTYASVDPQIVDAKVSEADICGVSIALLENALEWRPTTEAEQAERASILQML